VVAWSISIRFATLLMIAHPNVLRVGVVATISIALHALNRKPEIRDEAVEQPSVSSSPA